MIPFNKPLVTGNEPRYLAQVMENRHFSGDGPFSKKCAQWFKDKTGTKKALLTTSCTHALEIAALALDIRPGDEVIMPSFTFVSTANAFVLRGATIVFTDIRPDTMIIDETKIEAAITPRTKAIVPVHYAGIGCDMDAIMAIAQKHGLFVVEDAAQAVNATYKGRQLGSIGHLGCYSFHETKNYQCGEGGAILINDARLAEAIEIIREKGTDRSKFLRGEVDKYSWVNVGSSYLPSELNASFLYAQLENVDVVSNKRRALWQQYYDRLLPLAQEGLLELPGPAPDCYGNGHIFYVKLAGIDERQNLIEFLKQSGIQSVFHYIPLHSSRAGRLFGRFHGEDVYTTTESERILRLPMYYDLAEEDVMRITQKIQEFFLMASVAVATSAGR